MKTLLIICGAPGSGKTTIAQSLVKSGLYDAYYEADMFMVNNEGKYEFLPKKLGEVHGLCKQAVEQAMQMGKNVIVSNTNIKPFERNVYIEMAKRRNYKVQTMIVDSDFGSVHGVPLEKVEEMRKNLFNMWEK